MRDQLNFTERRTELHRRFDPILQAPDNTRREKNDILEQMQNELQKITYDENRYTDTRLFSRATRLDIEIPSFTESELWQNTGKSLPLSAKGRLPMRRAIDEEKTRRRDVAAWWWKTVVIPGLAAGTGLVGALTGLFAILHHK
ncbi:MAG: hypothetical protein ABR905_11710 [Terracidiphilus sp.]|jgi:hypothetical protein